MRQYGESITTQIMMATVPHVTSGSELRKFQADGFLFDRVYHRNSKYTAHGSQLIFNMLKRSTCASFTPCEYSLKNRSINVG